MRSQELDCQFNTSVIVDHRWLLLRVGHGQSDKNRAIQGAHEKHCRAAHDVNACVVACAVVFAVVLPHPIAIGKRLAVRVALHDPWTGTCWRAGTHDHCTHPTNNTQMLVEHL